MFSLISGVVFYLFGIPQYNVLVLGLDNSGKSTFLYQVSNVCDRRKNKKSTPSLSPVKKHKTSEIDPDEVDHALNNNNSSSSEHKNELYALDPKLRKILPTMGQNVKRLEFDNMTLHFWDLPGQTGFRRIWPNYYNDTHAVVFMVDSADTARLNEARSELHQLLNAPQMKFAPFLVLANKQDLKTAVHYQSLVNTLQIMGCDAVHAHVQSSSSSSSQAMATEQKTPLESVDEEKQSIHHQHNSSSALTHRSIKVMCTCCLNKAGLEDAISWLVTSIPMAKKRLDYVAQTAQQSAQQADHKKK